jgi:hypothetical protein
VATPSDTGSIQAPAGAEQESQPPTDWDLQADLAAQDIVSDLVKGEKRKCSDSPTRPPWLGPCTRWGHFAWSEEPKRAGFQSGIPYLRLGKGCVLVLGFVGCAFGASKANGHLFDDLRDPDRDRSSVPDLSEINEPVGAERRARSTPSTERQVNVRLPTIAPIDKNLNKLRGLRGASENRASEDLPIAPESYASPGKPKKHSTRPKQPPCRLDRVDSVVSFYLLSSGAVV